AAYCPGGIAERAEVEKIIELVNARRTALVEGKQKNGLTGNNLPPAKGMTKISWSCELEEATQNNLFGKGCLKDPPGDAKGRAEILDSGLITSSNQNLVSSIQQVLASIDRTPIPWSGAPTLNYVSFVNDRYPNLMRSTTTELGCVFLTCSTGTDKQYTSYCLTNNRPLANDEVIYEVGTGVCSGCPQGTFCEVDSKLCASTLYAPGETLITGFKCRNSLIAEEWRENMLNVQNDNRRRLAKGTQRGKDGALLPTAKNMNELIWDCSLEDAAHELAAKCTDNVTPPANHGAVALLISTKANPCNATSMTEQAVKDVWKAGADRQENNKRVSGNDDFSQMAYYKTNGIGCSYNWCTGKLSLVCVYNYDGAAKAVKNLYAKGGAGDTCKRCEPNRNQENCVNGLCQVPLSYAYYGSVSFSVPTTSTICPKARLLATGWAKDKQIVYAKPAAAMPELTYDCDLEEEIMNGLIDCPGKPVTTRKSLANNFKLFKPYNSPVEDALQKVIKEWWSPLENIGIPDNKYHDSMEGTELGNYVNMAFYQTRRVGCGVKVCNREGRIEVQCGYVMDEPIYDGDNIYEVGATCKKCAKLTPAMKCSTLGGLCIP
ncbi:SCP-like protein, partial [Ancylostoma caninum]